MARTSPWLVVGLGNPERRYAHNRHNIGFMVADAWVGELSPPLAWREKWKGLYVSATGDFGRAVVLKPQTYMNKSGESVNAVATFHQVPPERVVVIHDELDFPFGRVAIKTGGGHGGHNGLRDIVRHLGSADFVRVRVGIGRPAHGDVSAWVLSDFSTEDAAELPDLIDHSRRAVSAILRDGLSAAMNEFNRLPT